jgi:hypothetical protein
MPDNVLLALHPDRSGSKASRIGASSVSMATTLSRRVLRPSAFHILAAGATLASAAIAACGGGGSANYRLCPDVSGPRLSAQTLSGAPTIARVDITGGCTVTALCIPSVEIPCAQVEILGGSGTSCVLTFTSVDGRSTSTTVAVTSDGPPYQCRRDLGGRVETAVDSHFEPASIAVDFSAPPADSGTD